MDILHTDFNIRMPNDYKENEFMDDQCKLFGVDLGTYVRCVQLGEFTEPVHCRE